MAHSEWGMCRSTWVSQEAEEQGKNVDEIFYYGFCGKEEVRLGKGA